MRGLPCSTYVPFSDYCRSTGSIPFPARLSARMKRSGVPLMSNNIAHTAVLALALLSVTWPASSQTFQDRWWSPIPSADAAEKPPTPTEQNKPLPGINRQERSQQHVTTQSHQLSGHARVSEQRRPAPVAQQKAHPRGVMVGKASFYAYPSGKTASGAPYRRDELTAASRTLPFGTRLRVTDLKTNKSVQVTVTDRGPASAHLILDLSLGAAHQLGIASRGIVQVRAEIIS
jgi:rare lipoprotein A